MDESGAVEWVRTCPQCGLLLRKRNPWDIVWCPRCRWVWYWRGGMLLAAGSGGRA